MIFSDSLVLSRVVQHKVTVMASLGERLVALSEAESTPERGVWLSEKLEDFKRKEGITEDTKPTIELIKLQVCLSQIKNEQDRLNYNEPILQW